MSRWSDESTKKWAIKLDSWKILIFKPEFLSINRRRMRRIDGGNKRLCYISFHLPNVYNSIFDPIPNTATRLRWNFVFFLSPNYQLFQNIFCLEIKNIVMLFSLSSLIYWIELICLCFKINAKLDDMSMHVVVVAPLQQGNGKDVFILQRTTIWYTTWSFSFPVLYLVFI